MKKYSFPERIIHSAFHLAVFLIETFSNTKKYAQKLVRYRAYPPGTLGRATAECLDRHGYGFVPGYASHDLKHTLLDFEMTPLGEIRMQAFMLGNGNWTPASLAIFAFGFFLLPQHWRAFRADFLRGRAALPVKTWTLAEYGAQDLQRLRKEVFAGAPETQPEQWSLSEWAKFASFGIVAAGGLGMLFCLPFLFSANLADLVGAGLPFIAGAILVVGGVTNLSILSRKIA